MLNTFHDVTAWACGQVLGPKNDKKLRSSIVKQFIRRAISTALWAGTFFPLTNLPKDPRHSLHSAPVPNYRNLR